MNHQLYGIIVALILTFPPTLVVIMILFPLMRLIRDIHVMRADLHLRYSNIQDDLRFIRHRSTIQVTAPPCAQESKP